MTNTIENLPAGYVELSDVAIHISELEKFTTDVDRFLKYLPAATEMGKHEPGSPDAMGIAEGVKSMEDLYLTLIELGRFHQTMAEDLRVELTERRFPA